MQVKESVKKIAHEICPFDLGICPLFSCSFFFGTGRMALLFQHM